jgi:hypothetical protein
MLPGTRPSQAANCRALLNTLMSATITAIRDAVIGPAPGIVARRRAVASCRAWQGIRRRLAAGRTRQSRRCRRHPPKSNRKATITYDKDMYRWRHLIENWIARLKGFRAIATRYDKTDDSFQANIHLAAAIIAAR